MQMANTETPTVDSPPTPGRLEAHLRDRRDHGRKLLVPYITAGYPSDTWPLLVDGLATAGADAIEIGIPFSDPVMDGPTIQESSTAALEAGITPERTFSMLAEQNPQVPLIAMTYYNICYRMGHRRFAAELANAGICAAILPDLPLEEVGPWARAADAAGIETVLLAAPTAPDSRLPAIVERSRGFVYGVGLVGITGERDELAASAADMARRLKAITDKPVLIGVGVSNPEQAAEVAEVADGVIVGSAVIRKMLDGGSIEPAVEFVAQLRAGLDSLGQA
jgi:tryptophan synthase alpha chain